MELYHPVDLQEEVMKLTGIILDHICSHKAQTV